jgi:hypothetical protein
MVPGKAPGIIRCSCPATASGKLYGRAPSRAGGIRIGRSVVAQRVPTGCLAGLACAISPARKSAFVAVRTARERPDRARSIIPVGTSRLSRRGWPCRRRFRRRCGVFWSPCRSSTLPPRRGAGAGAHVSARRSSAAKTMVSTRSNPGDGSVRCLLIGCGRCGADASGQLGQLAVEALGLLEVWYVTDAFVPRSLRGRASSEDVLGHRR